MTVFCLAVCLLQPGPANVPTQSIAVDKFAAERAAAVKRLIETATAAAPVPARANEAAIAFRTLGHMRAAEAVPILLAHLAFDPHGGRAGVSGGPAFHADQPTVYALCQIGVPALDPLMKRAGDGDKAAATYAAVVVRRVLGEDLGRAYLGLKVAAEPNPDRAARLKKALAAVGAVDPYFLREEPPAGSQQGYPGK